MRSPYLPTNSKMTIAFGSQMSFPQPPFIVATSIKKFLETFFDRHVMFGFFHLTSVGAELRRLPTLETTQFSRNQNIRRTITESVDLRLIRRRINVEIVHAAVEYPDIVSRLQIECRRDRN